MFLVANRASLEKVDDREDCKDRTGAQFSMRLKRDVVNLLPKPCSSMQIKRKIANLQPNARDQALKV